MGNPKIRKLSGRIGGISLKRPGDPILADLRHELAEEVVEDRIRETLESAPPLTAERRMRIAAILFAPDLDRASEPTEAA